MAARGSLLHALSLLVALLAVAVFAAPAAHAQDAWGTDPAATQTAPSGDGWDASADGGWQEPSDVTGQPVQTVPAPEVPGVELPATPWTPPAAPATPAIPTLPVPKAKI